MTRGEKTNKKDEDNGSKNHSQNIVYEVLDLMSYFKQNDFKISKLLSFLRVDIFSLKKVHFWWS